MPRVIITGAPGAGKTTLLAALAAFGHRTVPESARALIAERLDAGLSPRPDPDRFVREILQRDLVRCQQEPAGPGWVFFDRGLPESLAGAEAAGLIAPEQAARLRRAFAFHTTVFVPPPWAAIHVQDRERDQDFAEALAVHARVLACYRALGFAIEILPLAPPEARARHVLAVLGEPPPG